MSYYCIECEKEHKEGYKKHLKYAGVKPHGFVEFVPEDIKEMVEHFNIHEKINKLEAFQEEVMEFVTNHVDNPKNYIGLMERIEMLEDKLETVIAILKSWKVFVDRKHPYKHLYEPLFEVFEL